MDSLGRVAAKLRISVTDRCNFRCVFCMPEEPVWLPRDEILTYEEIAHVATILASSGVRKIRLTGGEPTVRRELEKLVQMLNLVQGITDVSITTNGYSLQEKASVLKKAGLKGVTISLHSLRPERFAEITGKDLYSTVFNGITKAIEVGFSPIKINTVVIRGCNDDEIVDFVRLAHESGLTIRFIEYMPFDGKRLWGMEKVVSGAEIIERANEAFRLTPIPREAGSTAQVYAFADSPGRIGVITSITSPFCDDCDRIRLTADGKIVPCMWDHAEYDLKPLLRNGASDEEIGDYMAECVRLKAEGVGALIEKLVPLQHVRPMHTLGG